MSGDVGPEEAEGDRQRQEREAVDQGRGLLVGAGLEVLSDQTPWWFTQMMPITQKLTKKAAKEGHSSLSWCQS